MNTQQDLMDYVLWRLMLLEALDDVGETVAVINFTALYARNRGFVQNGMRIFSTPFFIEL